MPSSASDTDTTARDAQPVRQWHVQFILQRHFSLLAYAAAVDALATANLVSRGTLYRYSCIAESAEPVLSDVGIRVQADANWSGHRPTDTKHSADVVIVCGGYRCSLTERHAVTRWLQQAEREGALLGGIWNGVVALAHAGLLTGYRCAVHPATQDLMARHFPDIQIDDHPLVVDRQRWSAAGPNSALDLMLALVQRHHGAKLVKKIRHILQTDIHHRNDLDSALALASEQQYPDVLQRALDLMRNNIDEPLTRDELATLLNCSLRRLERTFDSTLGTSPARHYLSIRLHHAEALLLQGETSIADVARRTGFVSAAHFSRAFRNYFDATPRAVRQRGRQR